MQVASLGLVKAIDRFDATRAVAFSSYAVPTILGEIKRHFRDRTWSVRVPRDLQETALKVERAVNELTRDLHRQPTVPELGLHLGISEEAALEALQAAGAYHATSLDMPRGTESEPGDTLADTLGGDEDGYDKAEDRATIDRLMRSITPREREVLRLRFEQDRRRPRSARSSASRRCRSRGSSARRSRGCGSPLEALLGLRLRSSTDARSNLADEPVAQEREAHRRRDRGQQPAIVLVERLDLVEDQHQHAEHLAGDRDRHADRMQSLGNAERARRRLLEPRAVDVAQRAADLRVAPRRSARSLPAPRGACRAARAGR